jgi:hypothetical protein
MDPRKFSLFFGISTLIVGVLSLIPSLVGTVEGLPELALPISYGNFLGYFPLNVMNKGALISVGIFGILAATAKFNALPRSINYARATSLLMAAMAVLGLIPQTNTLFGYWPLFGTYNVAASSLFAVISGAYGYYLTSKVRDSGPAVRDFTAPMTSR